MQVVKIFVVAMLLLINIGCSEDKASLADHITYTFTAKLVSIVSHTKTEVEGVPVDYTIQVTDFNPVDKEFQKYISQFVQGDYKHIHLTKQTTIKDYNDEYIEVNQLALNSLITFTVVFAKDEYNLFATAIQMSE